MDAIRFLEPDVLKPFLLLVVCCLVAWLFVVVYKRVRRPKETRGSRYPFIGKERLWFFVVVTVALAIVAYARPYTNKGIPITKGGCIELIIALDASVSMLADDVGQQRLEVAKKELPKLYREKILNEDCDRISFFTFDGLPRSELPYSRDKDRFLSEVDAVSTVKNLISGDESPWYSDITAVLEKVRQARDSQVAVLRRYFPEDVEIATTTPGSRTIVLLVTDGDIEVSDSVRERFSDAIGALQERRLRVYGLGIGTHTGVPLLKILSYPSLLGRINDSMVSQLSEEWRGIYTRLDTRVLDEIASRTGGAVSTIDAQGESASAFFERIVSSNRPRMISVEKSAVDASQELWWYVLNGAVLVLFIGILLL